MTPLDDPNASAPELQPSRPYFDLPGYELLEKLREDSLGILWKARQIDTDRVVIVRTLLDGGWGKISPNNRFRQQMQDTAALKGGGIIQVLDAGEIEETLYFVTEYLEGYTIGEYLAGNGPLAETAALQIALGVATAIEYAWQRLGIIHGDIVPDNILVERDHGTVRLAGFGLVSTLNKIHAKSDEALFFGTPSYASPEQAGGERELDCASDVYSLGATLYHMVTGHRPFEESLGTTQTLEKQQFEFLKDPLDLRADLSPATASLIEKMMIRDRYLRPSEWSQVIADLRHAIDGYRPAGELPQEGASTILRNAQRSRNPGLPPPFGAEGGDSSKQTSVELPPLGLKREAAPARPESAASSEAKLPEPPPVGKLYIPVESENGEAPVAPKRKRSAVKKPLPRRGAAPEEVNFAENLGMFLKTVTLGFIAAALYVLATNPPPPPKADSAATPPPETVILTPAAQPGDSSQ